MAISLSFIIKHTSNMIDIKICSNIRAIKFLNQALKKGQVLLLANDKIAKGEIIINTFIRIYLIAYETERLKNPKVIELFIIPSKLNKLKELDVKYSFGSTSSISVENEILKLKR